MMTSRDVVTVVDHLTASQVRIWLDGGWGIDALVGEQTRDHDDLDVVIALHAVDTLKTALAPLGFVVVEDELPTRLVLGGPDDRRMDVHAVTFDETGGAVQVLHDGTRWRYPAEGFGGAGMVDGRPVACLTPEVQVLAHLGYEPDEQDRYDMRLLRDRLGMAMPETFEP
jgi:lincosamide nucleotidyltransferase A/C/D/E